MLKGSDIVTAEKVFRTEYNRAVAEYEATSAWDQMATIGTEIPSTGAEEDYRWLQEMPEFEEWLGDLNSKDLEDYSYTIRNKEFAASVAIHVNELEDDKYDIITGLYVGNFPDPDGFLDPLMETSKARFGVIPSRDLFTAIEKVRYVTPAEKRLEEYSRILRSFEDNWYLVPLYRISVPIIHNAQLSIPDTSFRYEAELWNMFWSD